MKIASLILFCAAALNAEQLYKGFSESNGIHVQLESRLEPGSPPITKHGGGILTGNNVIKRHFCNFDNHTYFGYDLTLERIGDSKIRLRFAPLSMPPEQMSKIYEKVQTWKPLTLPAGAPASIDAHIGDTIALDLFVNSSTGQKVTEYIKVIGDNAP